MTLSNVLSDDPRLGAPQYISRHSIRDHMGIGFDPDEEFYVLRGRPYAGRCDRDLYSRHVGSVHGRNKLSPIQQML
jgi:hypothetical protein